MDGHTVKDEERADTPVATPVEPGLPATVAAAAAAVIDALDVETCLFCQDETEGRKLILQLLRGLGFADADVVSAVHRGGVARVRARAYVNRPGVPYPWLGEVGKR